MAGKISLVTLLALASGLFGYAVRETQHKNIMLPFRVARVVLESDSEAISIDGLKPPFTVLVYEDHAQQILPGEIGRLGDQIFLPDPRHSSPSTNCP